MQGRPAKLGEGGGGKFGNKDGVIKDYEFTTVHPFAQEGKRSKSDFNPLYAVLTARMDDSEEDDIDVLLVGSADEFEIEDNGKTLVPAEEGRQIWAKSQWGKFIASLEAAGCATENPDYEEGAAFNYEPIINHRVHFIQEEQFDKSGKLKMRKGKGRDGKPREFKDTTTVVSADFGEVDAAPTKRGAKTTVASKTSKVTKAAGGRPNGKAVEVDLDEQADEAILGVLGLFGGSCPKTKLTDAKAQLYLKKHFADTSDELRRMLFDVDYLTAAAERGVITFDQASKAQTVAVA